MKTAAGISYTRAMLSMVIAMSWLLPYGCNSPVRSGKESGTRWRVYAMKYGITPKFRRATLIRGDETGGNTALAWEAWLICGEDRLILVDTGFEDPRLAKRWGVKDFCTVSNRLSGLGIRSTQITDVILTHAHWDHIGAVEPYTAARIWFAKEEFDWSRHLVSRSKPARWGVRFDDIAVLEGLLQARRLHLVQRSCEIAPGVYMHPGGGHTKAIEWVEVRTGGPAGTIVLASDNAYLFESIQDLVPTGSTSTPQKDVQVLKEMRRTASRPDLVVPGHDPKTFEMFPRVLEDVVEIR